MNIAFGARAIVTHPEEDSAEFQGREGICVMEIDADARGLRRVLLAFPNETSLTRFYVHEVTVQRAAPQIRTVERVSVVKQKPSATEVNAAARRLVALLVREVDMRQRESA